ncbi:MAG: APC family permease, partial [Gammaproteobacteria bacterium]|nr:APC family permease [Gammaproteobacteria bacterium]
MQMSERDAGLRRAVGPWGFTANGVNSIVGGGIFVVPAALAAQTGTWAIVVLLACALAVGAVAVCFAEGGSRVPSSGGAYAYIANAFGPMNGHIVGTMLWFSNLLADGGIAAALGDTVASVAPPAAAAAVRALVIVGVIGGIAVVNLLSVRAGVRLLGGATVIKMLPLAAFLLFGASGVRAANLGLHSVGTANLAGIGRAGILAVFA